MPTEVASAAVADSDGLFLRPETKLEPLACRWFAWPHLVSPAQQAMNIVFRQLPLLRSFLANPRVHAAAARDLRMLGGAFVRLTESRCGEVEALIRRTIEDNRHLIAFAEELRKLNGLLQGGARGGSLAGFYAQLPEALRGTVELVYDVNNQPKIRILEPIVMSALDNGHNQEMLLHRGRDTERDFFLNTPRIEEQGRVFVSRRHSDPVWDRLAAARTSPARLSELEDALGIGGDAAGDFRALFTDSPPARRQPAFDGAGVRVRSFGHACVLVQTRHESILFDPLVAWDPSGATLTFADLPDIIDYVVLTHDHQDHFSLETLIQLRARIRRVLVPRNDLGNIADPSMKLALQGIGIREVQVLDPFDSVPLRDGEIVSLPSYGEHADLDITSKQSILLRTAGRSLLFLCDSDCLDAMLYRRISQGIGSIDALFIGMECRGAPLSWLYGPYLHTPVSRRDDESRRLNGSDCAKAVAVLDETRSRQVWVYAMGQEPWLTHLLGLAYSPESVQMVESAMFVERCKARGVPAERLSGCSEWTMS